MGENTNEHRIGSLTARVDGLNSDHNELKTELRAIRLELTEINKNIAAAGGGWKVIVVMGAMIAAVSAMITSWLHK